MSSPNKSSSPAAEGSSNGNAANAADEKPRLTEEEKKQNHIASGALSLSPPSFFLSPSALAALLLPFLFAIPSTDGETLRLRAPPHAEQKRRQAIREGFDRLTELVPGLEGQGRSEGIVLKRTVDFMRDQLEERRQLVQAIEQRGGHVDDAIKK
jgi:hypothetical protein